MKNNILFTGDRTCTSEVNNARLCTLIKVEESTVLRAKFSRQLHIITKIRCNRRPLTKDTMDYTRTYGKQLFYYYLTSKINAVDFFK